MLTYSVVMGGTGRAPHLGGALPFMSVTASCSIACASLTLPGSPLPAQSPLGALSGRHAHDSGTTRPPMQCLRRCLRIACTCRQPSACGPPLSLHACRSGMLEARDFQLSQASMKHSGAAQGAEHGSQSDVGTETHRYEPGWPPLNTRLRRHPCAYSSTPASTRCRSVAVGVPLLHTAAQRVKALLPQVCQPQLSRIWLAWGADLRSAKPSTKPTSPVTSDGRKALRQSAIRC